jgi:prepilin-type N-terminal cleavage/methylation domain-containing protein
LSTLRTCEHDTGPAATGPALPSLINRAARAVHRRKGWRPGQAVHPPRSRDAGFSAIELLVVIAILPLIVGAISYAFMEIVSANGTVGKSISDSADAQVLSANYVQDVQSAQEITTSAGVTGQCGSTGTQLLGLEWGGYLPGGSGPELYQTVVSYDRVQSGTTYSLVRSYCSAGPSSTPTGTTTVSSDIASTQGVPTVAPASFASLAASGWTSTVGVTGVSMSLTEPGSNYSYSLTGVPAPGQRGVSSQLSAQYPGCTPTPGTGTYSGSLCFADFSGFKWSSASGSGCQQVSQGLAGTPFTLSFCVHVSGSGTDNGQVGAATIPTYYDASGPDNSEAYLGNNGFYTGIPGRPALYQCSAAPGVAVDPLGCPTNGGGGPENTTISFTNIQVTGPSGASATGWQLVTGDAESTDTGEWIAWTTCPQLTPGTGTSSSNGGPQNNQIYSGTGCGTSSSSPNLTLLPNSPTSPYGNDCSYSSYTYTGGSPANPQGTYLEWTAGSTGTTPSITPANPNSTNSVECAEDGQSNKTGTAMLEAPAPKTLTVNMNGGGAQAIFLGILL